jgi:hypothetical protein
MKLPPDRRQRIGLNDEVHARPRNRWLLDRDCPAWRRFTTRRGLAQSLGHGCGMIPRK